MKRFFIILSTILFSCFVIIMLFQQNQQLSFSSYNAVDVIGKLPDGQGDTNRESVTKALEDLANTHGSLIARRIVQPNHKGEISFSYQFYGKGIHPSNLKEANSESAETSDLVSNYLIVSGPLSSEQLVSTLNQLGFNARAYSSESLLSLLGGILINDISLISLILLLLTFAALTLIYRIRDLRFAGIKLVSGKSLLSIMWQSFVDDGKIILMTYLGASLAGLLAMAVLGIFQPLLIELFLLGVVLYCVLLIAISLGLGMTYVLGLKAVSLVDVLKGRLPLKRLLALMLIGQFIAIVLVGWSMTKLLTSYHSFVEIDNARQEWQLNKDYYQLSYSYSSAFTHGNETDNQNKAWYDFAKQSLTQGGAIFVKTNLQNFLVSDLSDGVRATDYLPNGNTIFVSPSYLEKQDIPVSNAFRTQMQQLKEGEFGLILPEQVKDQKESLEATYSQYMSGFASENLESNGRKLFSTKAYTATVPNHEKRFLYNTDENTTTQFLLDPIIVVTTPQAMGNTANSQLFWGAEIGTGLHLLGYDQTITSLKNQGVYQWVSYVTNDQMTYYRHLKESQNRLLFLGIGLVLGVVTSVLLFDSMNLLYFEQYRKAIFIKHLAGLSFVEVHFLYLMTQICVCGFALVALIVMLRQVSVSVLVVAFFVVNLLIILYRQTLSENKLAPSILKGE